MHCLTATLKCPVYIRSRDQRPNNKRENGILQRYFGISMMTLVNESNWLEFNHIITKVLMKIPPHDIKTGET